MERWAIQSKGASRVFMRGSQFRKCTMVLGARQGVLDARGMTQWARNTAGRRTRTAEGQRAGRGRMAETEQAGVTYRFDRLSQFSRRPRGELQRWPHQSVLLGAGLGCVIAWALPPISPRPLCRRSSSRSAPRASSAKESVQ